MRSMALIWGYIATSMLNKHKNEGGSKKGEQFS